MSNPGREQRIRERLVAAFAPTELVVDDQSHLHVGHAGAAGGQGHFRVHIVARAFAGLLPVARHRLVYEALGDLMRTDIHALAIEARAPAGGDSFDGRPAAG
ncbi:MAG: BolA family transcriptional regulator [Gammaproteobacteria bacterium]|nr:BolA family transcriptional regulator [Gammaproteobacteria bacterium]